MANSVNIQAEKMAGQHKEISVSEFFEKNRHLLGYDNKIKALLIIIKEAVDNALDAAEEARILPQIYVKIEEIEKEKYRMVIKDNGPGIVKKQIPKIFGTLLYGSKFHRLRQSRGQQGLGVSCAVLYAQLTTGQPTEIVSSTGNGKTHRYKLKIDVKGNKPVIISDEIIDGKDWNGVQIAFSVEGLYREHKQSVLEYLKQTAISNPYANIVFDSPTGRFEFKRGVEELPAEPKEIKPHLHGIEVGLMGRMMSETKARTLVTFLTTEFSRIGRMTATQIIKNAGIVQVNPKTNTEEPAVNISPRKLDEEQIISLVKTIKDTKLTKPPTDVLSVLGEKFMIEGLKKELNPEFSVATTRPPAVYRGWPFQIEAAIVYGGDVQSPKILRFANRVPLLYQAGDCAMTKSVMEVDWRRYGIETEKGPAGPINIMIHIASVWVPFTSESKEAVASYPIILKETKLALQECARKLGIYINKKFKSQVAAKNREMFKNYSGEIADALSQMTKQKKESIYENLIKIAQKMYASGLIEATPEEVAETQESKAEKKEEKTEQKTEEAKTEEKGEQTTLKGEKKVEEKSGS